MEMKSIPPSYDELIETLYREGSIYFLIERRHKKRFHRCIRRLEKLHKLMRRRRRFVTTLYAVYVGLLQVALTSGHVNLDNAVTVFQVAWPHIALFEGEDYADDLCKVTYHARASHRA